MLKAKVLQLPTMLMEMFDNVLENIDENYAFSLSPLLILDLLVSVDICVIALGVIFIWYKRKTSLTSSTVGSLDKLVPSLNDKLPSLNSLLTILWHPLKINYDYTYCCFQSITNYTG